MRKGLRPAMLAFKTLASCALVSAVAMPIVSFAQVVGESQTEILTESEAADAYTEEGLALRPNIIGDRVVLRTLDKITAATKDYDVKIGETLTFGSLTVDVKHCEVKPPEAIPETFAFLQIFEPPQLSDKERAKLSGEPDPIKLFSGWMLASKPAISALDHPVYDVWVIGCKGETINP